MKELAMSLRHKTAALFLLALLVAGSYYAIFWVPQAESQSEKDVAAFTRQQLVTISNGLVPFLLQNQLASIHEILDVLRADNPDWRRVILYDQMDRRIYPLGTLREPTGEFIRTFEQPIYWYDDQFGRLSVSVDLGPKLAEERQFHEGLAVSLVEGFVLIIMAFGLFMDFAVRRPVGQLARAAAELAQGNFRTKLPPARHDEVGTLIVSFASMRDRIQSDRTALEQARDELEQRVQERTAELQTANQSLSESEARINAVF